MACQTDDFDIGERRPHTVGGVAVETADATTTGYGMEGVCLWVAGRFRGFIGSDAAALEWAAEIVAK